MTRVASGGRVRVSLAPAGANRLAATGAFKVKPGMSALLGYEDGLPLNSGQMYPDAVAGFYGCSAILTAIHHRDRTGEGQEIDLSMQDANLSLSLIHISEPTRPY